jgi:hypothetical protein
MGRLIVNVPLKDVECDETWGFVGKKEERNSSDRGSWMYDWCQPRGRNGNPG